MKRRPSRASQIVATYAELKHLAETAKRFGITKQRVSQIVRRHCPEGLVAFKRSGSSVSVLR